MKKILLCLLTVCLLLAGCASSPASGSYQLYFPRVSYVEGPALGTQAFTPSGGEDGAEALLTALLAGPDDPELYSPFPHGVSLRACSLREGVLYLNLSEQYDGLSGIDLTLADCAITLTLCQLEEVSGVCIMVENGSLPARYRQVLAAQDILLPTE